MINWLMHLLGLDSSPTPRKPPPGHLARGDPELLLVEDEEEESPPVLENWQITGEPHFPLHQPLGSGFEDTRSWPGQEDTLHHLDLEDRPDLYGAEEGSGWELDDSSESGFGCLDDDDDTDDGFGWLEDD